MPRCSNMKEICEKANGDEELKAVIQSTLKNLTGFIEDCFEEFSLKRQKFKIVEAVSEEDLRGQFAFGYDIDLFIYLLTFILRG